MTDESCDTNRHPELANERPGDYAARAADALYSAPQATAGVTEEKVARMEDALHKIDQWSRAYPLSVFAEPDFAKAAELLKAGGMTLDAISASNMRHVVETVGKIARDALERKP